MVVFIEYVLIDNFFIDYLLLKTTFFIMNLTVKKSRLVVSAFLGALFSLAFPIINLANVLTLILKILVGLTLVMISYKFTDFRSYYVSCVVFLTLTFLTGGAIIGVYNLIGIKYSTEISIAVMILPVYILLKLGVAVIKFLYVKRHTVNLTYEVEIFALGNTVKASGFLDTGNFLYDGFSPTIVISKRLFEILLKSGSLTEIKKQKIATVNGEQEKISFKCDKLVIKDRGELNIFNNVTVVVTKNLCVGGVDVLLHPALMEGENAKTYQAKTS